MIVLRNARILPELTEGFEGTTADIVIDGGLIQEIKQACSASGSKVLDMTGKTVIPGQRRVNHSIRERTAGCL